MEETWAFTLFLIGVLLLAKLYNEYQLKELLMSLSNELDAISDQLEKAKNEITGKIGDLEGALASAGEQPKEVTEAVAALKQVAQGLDDLVEDAPAEVEDAAEVPDEVPAEVEDPAEVPDEVPAEVPVEVPDEVVAADEPPSA